MANRMRPIHPGEILAGELEDVGQRPGQGARRARQQDRRHPQRWRGITADTALRLARFFGTTPEFWLNLQQSYDLKLALRASKGRIAKTVRPRAGVEFLADDDGLGVRLTAK